MPLKLFGQYTSEEIRKDCTAYFKGSPCSFPRCNCSGDEIDARLEVQHSSLDHPAANVAMQVPTANQKKETKPMNEEAIAVLKHKIQETEAEARKWDAYAKDHQQDVEKGKLLVQQCHDIIAKYRSAITLLAHLNITKD